MTGNSLRKKPTSARTRRSLRMASAKKWRDPIYRDKTIKAVLKASKNQPNKTEKRLWDMLNIWCPNKFKFVGDGQLIIKGKCPDYVGGNMLIEMFGDYWHRGQTGIERTALFKSCGYETLIIWEHEIKDQAVLKQKVLDFVKQYEQSTEISN